MGRAKEIIIKVIPSNDSGLIRAEPPRMSRMLEMLDPRTFPSASWPWPLAAATTQVASSGSEVPAAIMVIAMNFSESPAICAI